MIRLNLEKPKPGRPAYRRMSVWGVVVLILPMVLKALEAFGILPKGLFDDWLPSILGAGAGTALLGNYRHTSN
jgi:hypothetical protein